MLPRIDLRAIRCFALLAQERHFGRAAARMAITQPSFSAQIARLETELGFRLFARNTRSVELTAEGVALLPQAQALLAEAERFAEVAAMRRTAASGVVMLGTPLYTFSLAEHDVLLASIARDLAAIDLKVDNGFTGTLIEQLDRGEIDMALVIAATIPRAAYRAALAAHEVNELVVPDDLECLVVRAEPIVLAIPDEHPLAVHDAVPIEALAGVRIAALSAQHGRAVLDPVERALRAGDAQLFTPAEAHGWAMERYCRQHRVPALSVGWFRPEEPDGVVYRPIADVTVSTALMLVRVAGRPASAAASLVWDHAQRLFAAVD